VTPLNSEHYLVLARLTLKIILDGQGTLKIAGFLRKEPSNDEAIMMVDSSSGEVLGINRQFAALTKFKVMGRQITQVGATLISILPEIKPAHLVENVCQLSHLEIAPPSGEEHS
jgi:hypothetical protein